MSLPPVSHHYVLCASIHTGVKFESARGNRRGLCGEPPGPDTAQLRSGASHSWLPPRFGAACRHNNVNGIAPSLCRRPSWETGRTARRLKVETSGRGGTYNSRAGIVQEQILSPADRADCLLTTSDPLAASHNAVWGESQHRRLQGNTFLPQIQLKRLAFGL